MANAASPSEPIAQSAKAQGRVQGSVEQFDLARGIVGWAIDLEHPNAKLAADLLIGETVVARTFVDRVRTNLAIAPGHSLAAGFVFPDSVRASIRDAVVAGAIGTFGVRIVGASNLLPMQSPPPDISEAMAEEGSAPTPAPGGESGGFDLVTRLCQLRDRSADMPRPSLRADPKNLAGYVEQMAIDESGLVWFSGWMKATGAADIAALIFDGQRTPASMAVTTYTRDDVASDATGVMGVIQTEWRPSAGFEFIIFLGEGQTFLQGVKTFKLVTKQAFSEHFNYRWPLRSGGHGAALKYLLDNPDSWQPTEDASGARVSASVEEVYALPSFGCLVSGWALSPLKPIENFAMRFGATVLACDRESISFHPRPDLAGSAYGCDLLPGRGGFVAVFRGKLDTRELDSPVLKVLLPDGTASIHSVDPHAVRMIGHAVSLDRLRELYPTLTAESFFADLAMAVRQDACDRGARIMPLHVTTCETSLVFVLPVERSDALLMFDQLARRLEEVPAGTGITIIADRGTSRSVAVSLLEQLKLRDGLASSLFLTDDAPGALYALPQILAATESDRFAFCGSRAILTDAGWRAALANDGGLRFIGLQDPAARGAAGVQSFDAFAWRREPFIEWLERTPPFLGGSPADAAVPAGDGEHGVVAVGAYLLEPDAPSALLMAINRVGAAR